MDASFGLYTGRPKQARREKQELASRQGFPHALRRHHRMGEGMSASCKRCSLSMRTSATHERSQVSASKDKDKEKYDDRQQAVPASP